MDIAYLYLHDNNFYIIDLNNEENNFILNILTNNYYK